MKYSLKELLDIPRLRELLGSFDEIHSMPSAIIDIEGNVLIANAWQDICTRFHRVNPETEKKCIESDTHIESELDKKKGYVVYRCPMGLVDSAMPLIIEGKHLGNVFTGQLFIDPPDEARFIEQARQYGFDETEYLAAMRRVPHFSEEHLHRNLTFIHSLTRMLAEQGLQNKRLQESEFRLQQIAEHSRAFFWEVDALGLYTYVSPVSEAVIGYRPDELVGRMYFHDLLPDPDRETVRRAAFEIFERKDFFSNFENSITAADGSLVWVNTNGIPILDETGKLLGYRGSDTDITERKQAEVALRENDRRLKEAQRIANMGYWECDLAGKTLVWSDGVYRIFEIDPHEFSGSYGSFVEAIHPDDREAVNRAYSESLADQTPYEIEHRLLMKDGRVKYVHERCESVFDANGQPLRSIGTVQDMTAHRLTEKELKNALLFNKHIVDSAQEGIVVYDRDLRFQLWNPYMEKLTGLSCSEVMGKTPSDLFPSMVESGVVEDLKKVLNGEAVEPREFRDLVPGSGRSGWVVQANAPLLNTQNEVIGVLGMVRDITEQKKTTEQLHQAQKMESIGRLAGGVAHDFNNMLGVIIGHAEIALAGLDCTQPIYFDLQEIHKAAQRSADLTRQLLAFARKQTISPKVVDLNDTVEGMLKMLRRLIGEDIDLLWKPGPALWPVKVDPSQVDQVLANLCVNARDAIAGVGRVTIETENVIFDESYCRDHHGFIPGDYVLLAVSDDGCGMPRKVLDNVFEPFFTTKEVGLGTGLGLATVYGIVRQNNGNINVYSEPGKGTSFKIYLPRGDTALPEAHLPPGDRKDLRGTETVLLVEDEESILNLGKTILEYYGYTVLAARKPSIALSLAENHPDPIHLLITDVVMPGMNGKELNERLCALRPDLRCIFMSGYTANVVARHGILEQGIHFLQKPFSVKSLAQKVREVLQS